MSVLLQIDYDRERPMIITAKFGMWGTNEYYGKKIIDFLYEKEYVLETNNRGIGVFIDMKYSGK